MCNQLCFGLLTAGAVLRWKGPNIGPATRLTCPVGAVAF